MEGLVTDILAFIETTNTSPMLKSAEKLVGSYMLRVISIKIADWLKLEYKREQRQGKTKPLKLNFNYDWCRSLKCIIDADSIFAKTFSIQGDTLNYSEYMDDDSCKKIRRIAFEGFNPPDFLTRRKE